MPTTQRSCQPGWQRGVCRLAGCMRRSPALRSSMGVTCQPAWSCSISSSGIGSRFPTPCYHVNSAVWGFRQVGSGLHYESFSTASRRTGEASFQMDLNSGVLLGTNARLMTALPFCLAKGLQTPHLDTLRVGKTNVIVSVIESMCVWWEKVAMCHYHHTFIAVTVVGTHSLLSQCLAHR